ncbi:MAG: isoprenylcysteine carboxylmethyltransferase family protein [Anaerolineales bacterium]|nr:MAG: isoprenylcysteine carboxylmethyltransferase family protein [Anaerolineales bacterium]
MIPFPAIWWLFPAVALVFTALSFLLTRSGKLESETVRKTLVGAGAMLGFLGLALPLFTQPTFQSPLVQYGFGLPLLILGLFGRVYPAIYLRQKGTTTTLDKVGKLVDSGPYAWVRHPQYTAGWVMLLGWFLAWGAWYALGFMPLIAGMIYAQARIEEKYILERMFGEAYAAYREQVGMLLPRLDGNDPLRVTTAFLGIYAGLIAIQHGIFEILQGNTAPDGLIFNAIGTPCQAEMVWHACFPAMTLIPNLLVTGIAAMLAGVGMTVWAAAFVGRRRGGRVLGLLTLLALLVGGGFVPVFIGMAAAVTAGNLGSPARPGGAGWRFVAALWPWPLVLMALWLPGNWLLGHFIGGTMLSASGLLFFVFDIGLPALAAVSGFGRAKR